MKRRRVDARCLRLATAFPTAALLATVLLIAMPARAAEPGVEQVLDRYAAARGGVERWQAVRALELSGHYATFSQRAPFRLVRHRDDLYRLDYQVMKAPAVRARGAAGTWMRHALLSPQASVVEDGPYRAQLEREAYFAPLLLTAVAQRTLPEPGPLVQQGLTVELLGRGEIDGRETFELRLVLPARDDQPAAEEVWHLDAKTYLEVAIDSTAHDFTQGEAAMRQRAFYDDFRRVDGLVLPFRVELELGARLETLEVEAVRVDPQLDPSIFEPPTDTHPDRGAGDESS
ncbi:MAG: hypothetical protein AAF560_23415 [Acidobacteriota bacterium]